MTAKRTIAISILTYLILSAFFIGFFELNEIVFADPEASELNIPSVVAYQGSVRAGNRAYDMTFRFFDAKAGGNIIWSEEHTEANENPVQVINHQYNVILGEVNPLGLDVFDGTLKWLEIEFDGNILAPRVLFASVPYAFRAAEADVALSVPEGSITQAHAPSLIQGFDDGLRIEYGTGSWSGVWAPNPAAGTWFRSTPITFSESFTEPPRVFVNLSSNDPEAWGIGGNVTTTGFDARNVSVVLIPNTDSDSFDWIAIGK